MGNMKFDGADVTFELDGYDALVERVRSKKVNCKINPSDLPRLYAVMDAELEGNEELAAAFAEAQEAAFGEAVLTVWAERIKSFKDSFIPVFGEACKDAACRFGFSKDGNNTFKSAVDAAAKAQADLNVSLLAQRDLMAEVAALKDRLAASEQRAAVAEAKVEVMTQMKGE